jgi:nucleoside triphosphate pyrophosphatase
VSVPPAPPIILASESPQRRAILEQLDIPFTVVPPRYEEHDSPDADPVELVREHARGKARSVGPHEECPVLGVDTAVVIDGESLGKPAGAAQAEAMLERLSGREHEVVSGLCLLTRGWEELHKETTRVTFRALNARDLAHYVGSGEWENRAGGYAIQGLGASLVARLEGDYLNVVGLPGPLLISLLTQHFPGTYGFG